MGRQTERVARLQAKVQAFFDLFPEVPQMFICETLDLPQNHLHSWIKRGKVTRPENLAKGHGYRYAGETLRDKPGKPPPAATAAPPPESQPPGGRGVVAPRPAPPPADDPWDDLPDVSIEDLRRRTKRHYAASLSDPKAAASYAQALKALMDIQTKEDARGGDDKADTMHSYVPDEDLGPDDE